MPRALDALWCTVEDCGRPRHKNLLCKGHFKRGPNATVLDQHPSLLRDADGNKRCCMCKEWLPESRFGKTPGKAKDDLQSACFPCNAKRRRARRFGLTDDWFEVTFEAQGSKCAICGSLEPRGRGWSIDHDHSCCPSKGSSCGKCIRGILCSPCNCALGMVNDNPDVLRSAIAYLGTYCEPA